MIPSEPQARVRSLTRQALADAHAAAPMFPNRRERFRQCLDNDGLT
jgi:hypothetical protein